MAERYIIEKLRAEHIPALDELVASGGHQTESAYFETALEEQQDRKRDVLLAYLGGDLVGYVHLNFFPQYIPFLRLKIPEIQDLFVHPAFRRQGVGETLIRACEKLTKESGVGHIGIGVGMTSRYGAAQRLYARLGYVPDGAGVVFDRVPVATGDVRPIDDRLCLMLIKDI